MRPTQGLSVMLITDQQLLVFYCLTDRKQITLLDAEVQGVPVPGSALGSSMAYRQDHRLTIFRHEQLSPLPLLSGVALCYTASKCPLFTTMAFPTTPFDLPVHVALPLQQNYPSSLLLGFILM